MTTLIVILIIGALLLNMSARPRAPFEPMIIHFEPLTEPEPRGCGWLIVAIVVVFIVIALTAS